LSGPGTKNPRGVRRRRGFKGQGPQGISVTGPCVRAVDHAPGGPGRQRPPCRRSCLVSCPG
jgi:hypothetical protein